MSEWSPGERTRSIAQEFVKEFLGRMPNLLGIDEVITGCELLALDPYGVGVGIVPRYVSVSLREFTQHVWYTGTIGLTIGDDYAVVHVKDGDRYEILGSTGTGGASGGAWVPPPGLVLGTGANTQVAYWTAVDTVAGDAGFTYNPATDTITVGAIDVASGGDIDPADASGQDLGDATHRWDLYTQNVYFGGGTGTNLITIPDNQAIALRIADPGIEYLKIETTNAGPAQKVVWNENGADVDYRIEASGAPNAFFVRGSDGRIGMGTNVPGADLHLYKAAGNITQKIETDNAGIASLLLDGTQVADLQLGIVSFLNAGDSIASVEGWRDGANDAGAFVFATQPAGGALTSRMVISSIGDIGVGTGLAAPSAQFHIDQSSASGGQPVLLLDQGDVSEQHIVCSINGADQDFPAIIELDVTGIPTLWWDESEDAFGLTHSLLMADGTWIGIGGALERIIFDAAGDISFMGCNVGVGMATPGYRVDILGTTAIAPAHLERSHTSTNAALNILELHSVSTGDMVDDFGVSMRFYIEDNAAVKNGIARIEALRDGADNEGALRFLAGTNGLEEFMRGNSAGNVGVGTAVPDRLLTLQGASGATVNMGIFAGDGDGTDTVGFNIFGVGTPGNTADRERVIFRYNGTSNDFEIFTEANGTGTLRPLNLYTEGHANQLFLATDGNVGIGETVPAGKTHIKVVDAAAIPALVLEQLDISEGTINFVASDRGVWGWPGTGPAHSVRVELNGTVYLLALYANQ